MDQFIPQEEVSRIIISYMVNKRSSIVPNSTLTSVKERGYYSLSLLSQYYNEQERFLDDFMEKNILWYHFINSTFERYYLPCGLYDVVFNRIM
jgi:hypothetical protein